MQSDRAEELANLYKFDDRRIALGSDYSAIGGVEEQLQAARAGNFASTIGNLAHFDNLPAPGGKAAP